MMRAALDVTVIALAVALLQCGAADQPPAAPGKPGPILETETTPSGPPLRPVGDFASIANREARSVALFGEAARVITSPRCMNCHPSDRRPTQGDDRHAHVPPMWGAEEGHGVAGLACKTCHQRENVRTLNEPIASIPGHPHWSLAPASMAWQGVPLPELCAQIKDPARNGNKSLAQLHEHMAKDTLVGWAWHPGAGRAAAPGTQQQLGRLIEAWIETGAHCPAP